jgi:hypothetical protein
MQGKNTVNTFNGGLKQDNDPLISSPNSLRDSMNGRLMFNKDGTYAWETENGSKNSVVITPNNGGNTNRYVIIGATGNDYVNILFSTDPINFNSEIGIFSIDESGIGSYKTLFNDLNDPNGDLLNFLTKNQIEARFVYENDKCIRVYWVDGVADDSNRPRTATIIYDPTVGIKTDVNAYTISNTSVFSFDTQTDFSMGLIKYVKNVGGNLLTGIYQYTYRLKTNEGYRTPFYPLTRRIFVNDDAVNANNWNEYEMGSVGLVSTKGNQIEIKGIDTRYDRIEVAYAYSQTSNIIFEAKVFSDVAIDGETMLFDNTGNIGEPLIVEEIVSLFSGVRGAKTLNIKDSTLYYGNIKENILPTIDIEEILSSLQVKPIFKDMRSDEWAYTTIIRRNNPPLTHGYPRTGITQLKNHNSAGGTEDYVIDNDYLNYKGTQVDHMYAGYFRGETYRLAIQFYDKLGFKNFAYHLCDINFPNQSESDYSWSRLQADGNIVNFSGGLAQSAWPTNNYNDPALQSEKVFVGDTGDNLPPMDVVNPSLGPEDRKISHIRIMGLEFSGIDVSSISNLISGFKIVRVERDKTILNQGLILPCVQVNDSEDGEIINPLPSTHQDFYDFVQGNPPTPTSALGDIQLNDPLGFNRDYNRFILKGNASVLYAPSIDFGTETFPSNQSGDRITLVGGAWDEYPAPSSLGTPYRQHSDYMRYSKQYYSKNLWHDIGGSSAPFPRYMSYMEDIDKVNILTARGEIEDWDGTLDLKNDCKIEALIPPSSQERRSIGKPNSIFVKHGNFIDPTNPVGVAPSPLYKNIESPRLFNDITTINGISEFMGSFIYNYVRPNPNPYGGLTSTAMEQSIFYGTGHFQPINNETFDNQGMPVGLVFDGIEVFGGDCYLDYFGMMRMYPHSQWDGVGSTDDDYADGRIFPLEYEYNHTLREASGAGGTGSSLIYPNVGARNWESLIGAGNSQWNDGLYIGPFDDEGNFVGILEEFNINAVLNFEELLIFYKTKPEGFKDNDRFPIRWRFTLNKIYGDPVDQWRIFQVNDFRDLNGEYGEITGSLYVFNQIYSWQSSAFGRLRASDRALIESQQGGTLSTGIGEKLDGIDYISTKFGTQHQWSLFKSDTAAYWTDVSKRKIMRFAQDGKVPLSDIKGIHQFLEIELPLFENNDNPVNNLGIHGVFDYGNNEAIVTFNRDRIINESTNNDFTLISRDIKGKTYSPYIIEQNQTALLNITIPNQSVFLPIGNVAIGVNENTIMYISGFNNNYDVYNVDDISSTLLFTALPNNFYRLFRYSKTEPWQFELVDSNDATPIKQSVSFNEYGNEFHSYHSFNPTFYFNSKYLVMSNYADDTYALDNVIYAHDLGRTGEFPGFSTKSYLTVISAENAMLSKVFDSIRINCNDDFATYFDNFLMRTESQFRIIDISNDTRKKYLEDILRFPLRSSNQTDRMRGKHIEMTLEIKNNFNHKDRITNLVTSYRISKRT